MKRILMVLILVVAACGGAEADPTTTAATPGNGGDTTTSADPATTTSSPSTTTPDTTPAPGGSTTAPPASTTTLPPPSTTEPIATTTTTAGPAVTLIEITVANGAVKGRTRIKVNVGAPLRLVVTADVADEVHVHGYDLYADVAPGQPATIEFAATIPGVFEVELEGAGLELLSLEVG